MNLSELKSALRLLTELAEGAAEKVMDVSASTPVDGFEFIGFQSRKNAVLKDQPTDEEEATKLLDSLHSALARRISDKNVTLWWATKPHVIVDANGLRVACRLKVTPAIIRPKLVAI